MNDKYKEYRVVSFLDLNAYYDVVKKSYDEAVTAFNGVKLQSVEYDIEFACMSAKQMLHKSSNCDKLHEHIIIYVKNCLRSILILLGNFM